MKKVLIGCGVLVLIGMVAMVSFVVWVKHKAEGFTATVKVLTAQNQEMQKLDREFPFAEPAAGQPLVITEPRLKDYLAVREEVWPVYADFKQKADAFQKAHPKSDKPDISGAIEATGLMSKLLTGVRAKVIDGLESHHMSPVEFRDLTMAIYESQPGPNAALLSKYKDALDKYKEGVGLDVVVTATDAQPPMPH